MIIPLPSPGDRVGDYRIVERIGQGGAGIVYKAERGGQFYAVKVLNDLSLKRWPRREMSTLLRLQVQQAAHFVSFDTWPKPGQGYPCIITDFIDGWTLDAWALRFNPGCREALTVFVKLTQALQEVFQQGVLHRDVKETNILVRASDGEPVLIDFGYSMLLGSPTETTPGMLPPGTPEYRSPEEMDFLYGGPDTHVYTYALSDELWALGVVLYWLLTDTLPFGERNIPGLNRRIREHSPEPPHTVNPRVPEAVSRLSLRMLDKRREERFQDYDTLLAALEELRTAARDDASWDVPLVDPEASGQSEADGDSKVPPPRRGGEPVVPTPVPAPVAAAPEVTPLPVPPLVLEPRASRLKSGLAVALGAAVLLAGVVFLARDTVQPEPLPGMSAQTEATRHTILFHGMAGTANPAEFDAGAAPLEAPPPAPDSNAMPNPSPAKTRAKKTPPQDKKALCPPVLTRVCVAGVCSFVLTACSGVPVRSENTTPPPEPCPPGAVEVMRDQLGIKLFDENDAEISPRSGTLVVREGKTSAKLMADFGKLPRGTVLQGKYLFDKEYIYGRYTQARRPNGDSFPICMQFTTGVPRLEKNGGDTARLNTAFGVQAVDVFE